MALMIRIAPLLIAAGLAGGNVLAQVDAAPPLPAACPAPADVLPAHLYGTWLATVEGEAQPVAVRFEKHPELAGSVAGQVERGGARIRVAGDVDDGDFTLEESSDGLRISATWLGRVVDASCGKEIKGTWTKATDTPLNANPPTNASPSAPRSFVLRKQVGWS